MFMSFDHFPLGYGSSQFLNLFILKGLVLCEMNCKYFFLTLSNTFWLNMVFQIWTECLNIYACIQIYPSFLWLLNSHPTYKGYHPPQPPSFPILLLLSSFLPLKSFSVHGWRMEANYFCFRNGFSTALISLVKVLVCRICGEAELNASHTAWGPEFVISSTYLKARSCKLSTGKVWRGRYR